MKGRVRRLAIVATGLALGGAGLIGAASAEAKGSAAAVADGARGLWVAQAGEPLVNFDYRTGRPGARVGAGPVVVDVSAGTGWAWAIDARTRTLSRVNQWPARVEARARLPIVPHEVRGANAGSVWVSGHAPGSGESVVVRLDQRTLAVRGSFHLGRRGLVRLAVGRRRAWLAFPPRSRRGDFALVGIDARLGRLAVRRRLPGAAMALAMGSENLWVLSREGPRSRLRAVAEDGTIASSRRGGPGPSLVGAASDLVWTAGALDPPGRGAPPRGRVHVYDERSGRLVGGPFRLGCGRDRRPRFPSDMAVWAHSAAVVVGDDRGRRELVVVSAGRGVLRCIPL